MDEQEERVYDQAFPELKPDERFWRAWLKLQDWLDEQIKVRPLGPMALKKIGRDYILRFRDACVDGRERTRKAATTSGA